MVFNLQPNTCFHCVGSQTKTTTTTTTRIIVIIIIIIIKVFSTFFHVWSFSSERIEDWKKRIAKKQRTVWRYLIFFPCMEMRRLEDYKVWRRIPYCFKDNCHSDCAKTTKSPFIIVFASHISQYFFYSKRWRVEFLR